MGITKSHSHFETSKTKVCNSCKRQLPINGSFGILMTSQDLYNPTCYDCRRFLRRKTYYKGLPPGSFIYPLNLSNELVLSKLKGRKLLFKAVCLHKNSKIIIEIIKKQTSVVIKFKDNEGKTQDFLVFSSSFSLTKILKDYLYTKSIRLLDPDLDP